VISTNDSTPEDIPALRDALKRCSSATYYAACKFRKFGRSDDLRTVLFGVLERFVERDLRPKLSAGDDTLRLREDLGIDSLTMMEIVMMAEEVLPIAVSNEELTELRTLGDVHAFLLAKAAPPGYAASAVKSTDNDGAWDLAAIGEEVRRIEADAARPITRLTS
jgi:acyl carrier protein